MIRYAEWLKKQLEMATIVTKKDCNNPDYQVQGAFCGEPKTTPAVPKKSKKKKRK